MKKRVLFINHAAGFGGGEIFLRDILLQHRSTRQAWEVLFLQNGPIVDELRQSGVDVKVLSAGKILNLKRRSKIADIFGAFFDFIKVFYSLFYIVRRYDLVCANSQKALSIGGLVSFVARVPFAWIVHDIISDSSFSPFMRKQIVISARFFAGRIIANSQATKVALSRSGVSGDKIDVVYNGFDFERSSGQFLDLTDRLALLSELALIDKPLVGMFGRMSPWKGQHILLKALCRLPDVQAIIVGDATYEDEEYEISLRKIVEEDGLQSRVKFLGFRSDVERLMCLVDIVVHTSVQPEPFGRVIVEGMLQRKPVIATAMGGVLEIVEDGFNGCLVRPGDDMQLSEVIYSLLRDSERAAKLSTNGYTSAVLRFSIGKTISDIDAIFEDLICP